MASVLGDYCLLCLCKFFKFNFCNPRLFIARCQFWRQIGDVSSLISTFEQICFRFKKCMYASAGLVVNYSYFSVS